MHNLYNSFIYSVHKRNIFEIAYRLWKCLIRESPQLSECDTSEFSSLPVQFYIAVVIPVNGLVSEQVSQQSKISKQKQNWQDR